MSWDNLDDVFSRLNTDGGGDPLQGVSLASEIEHTLSQCKLVQSNDLDAFFKRSVAENIMMRGVGTYLLQAGVRRHHLFDEESLRTLPPVTITNGLVVDVMTFSAKESINKRGVLEALGADFANVSITIFNKRMKAIMDKHRSLSKSVHRESGRKNFHIFLNQPAFSPIEHVPTKVTFQPPPEHTAFISSQNTCARLRRTLDEKDQAVTSAQNKITLMQEYCETKTSECEELSRKLHQAQGKTERLQHKLKRK